MALLIPFARRQIDGRSVDATMVVSGLKCGCECPSCGKPVIARHCTERVSHFAHPAVANCQATYESALHLAAKQVIVDLGFVWLPWSPVAEPKKFTFTRVEIEKALTGARPDLVAYTRQGRPLAVEIKVTHEVDEEKRQRMKASRLACVEYDLADLPRGILYRELTLSFQAGEIPSVWIHNDKIEAYFEEQAKRMIEEEKREARLQARREADAAREFAAWLRSPHAKARALPVRGGVAVVGCPIGRRGYVEDFKGIAFVKSDCPRCPFFVANSTPETITCIGHFPKMARTREVVGRFGGHPQFLSASSEPAAAFSPRNEAAVSPKNDNPF